MIGLPSKKPKPGSNAYKTLKDNFTWTCNLCKFVARGSTKHACQAARGYHLRTYHKNERAQATHAFAKPAQIVAAVDLPKDQRAWTCAHCGLGLPFLPDQSLRKSRASHVQACVGLTARQLYLKKIKTPEHRQLRKLQAKPLIEKRKKAASAKIKSIAAESGHDLLMLSSGVGTKQNRQWSFTCRICTRTRSNLSAMKPMCGGTKARAAAWKSRGNFSSWWRKFRKTSSPAADVLEQLVAWKATSLELKALDARIPRSTRKKFVPLQSCVWFRDLTREGIEPHPGPSRSLQGCSCNVNGCEGAWACAKMVFARRRDFAVFQELCMTDVKFTDFAQWCGQQGYRVFSVRNPDLVNCRGTRYSMGGVAILVHATCRCHQLQTWRSCEGAACFLDFDSFLLAGIYRRPKADLDEMLTTLQTWFTTCRRGPPCIAVGDWNETPTNFFADCFPQSEFVCVTDDSGNIIPSRWNGPRSIDWAWCSVPSIAHSQNFWPEKMSDHKVFDMQVKCPARLAPFCELVKTRDLSKPPEVARETWREALAEA